LLTTAQPQNKAKLDQYREQRKRSLLFQRVLGVPARVAAAMASVPRPAEKQMKQWLEDGRLPCYFSIKLLWSQVLTQLEQLDQSIATKRAAIAKEQQQRMQASQGANAAKREMKKLRSQIAAFEKAERAHAEAEKDLLAELEECQKMDVAALKPFVLSVAMVERKLVTQLEAQLVNDRECLFALKERESPKLSLLMNCFGADARTIQALRDFDSMELAASSIIEINLMVAALPREQQIVVLYTQDRLIHGKMPFAEHDCALCDCETPEEMANFLNENGLPTVTADIIRRTGAFGRGALLFLTAQELQLGNGKAQERALKQSRADHRKK
jgi:hypothetical protein